ncbi:putative protease Do-like 14 isoform X2 [Dendrobium catenatum]|uniref:Protease Do-like 14 n=2 Tax=Dendrobium catenatum TaxID=906689 RepID=A0A2I0WNW6_9ASPA|nr:putative protease Do-like 14 isoform X2 [Dendrobium catenatum]PKU77360.1 Putative protease Do-like 14 [Dendrobium catenatum]
MNLRRAVTPFLRGFFEHKGNWRCTSGSWCEFECYGFSEASKNVPEFSSRFGGRSDDFIKFATENVCPAIVYVTHKKGIGGSGIIIDSDGTVLTRACSNFSLDSRSKINISLNDGRKFLGTILESNEDHDLTLLKIQSEIPLPTTTFDYLEDYKGSELISFEHLLSRRAYPRPSSQNEVNKEGNLMLSDEEFISKLDYKNFHLGRCGGPIVTLDGDVVGICTQIDMMWPLGNGDYCGNINAMGIEEALCKVGYRKK